jgi:hypothetical protein
MTQTLYAHMNKIKIKKKKEALTTGEERKRLSLGFGSQMGLSFFLFCFSVLWTEPRA